MRKVFLATMAAAAMLILVGCTAPTARPPFAACKAAAAKALGSDADLGPSISACMEAHGYQLREAGYCYSLRSPGAVEACYMRIGQR